MQLINYLDKEELRNFKLSLRRIYLNNTKNSLSELADFIKKNPNQDDAELHHNFYNNTNKNSFYKLKHKLNEEILKSLLILNYKKDDYNKILNAILIARIFSFKGQYKIATKQLKIGIQLALG